MELQGKIVAFLGDSITEGVGVQNQENRYDNLLKKQFDFSKTYNMGIRGTRFAHQSKPSDEPLYDLCFCGRAYLIPEDAELIIVYGAVNDFIHGDAPFGKLGDKKPTTFCGGAYFLMQYLKTAHPQAEIVFLSPARAFYDDIDDLFPSARTMKAPDAKPLVAYVDTIKETARQFDIPVLDLYRNIGIDPHDAEQNEKYTADGLHFNDLGHHVLAKVVADFLQAL